MLFQFLCLLLCHTPTVQGKVLKCTSTLIFVVLYLYVPFLKELYYYMLMQNNKKLYNNEHTDHVVYSKTLYVYYIPWLYTGMHPTKNKSIQTGRVSFTLTAFLLLYFFV